MATTVIATLANAITPAGMQAMWQNAFGIASPVPDTAALVLASTDLADGAILPTYTLSNLTLDKASYTSMTGAFTVSLAADTGLVVASFSTSLPANTADTYSGAVLFHNESQTLFYISLFIPEQGPNQSNVIWNAKITLGTSQGC